MDLLDHEGFDCDQKKTIDGLIELVEKLPDNKKPGTFNNLSLPLEGFCRGKGSSRSGVPGVRLQVQEYERENQFGGKQEDEWLKVKKMRKVLGIPGEPTGHALYVESHNDQARIYNCLNSWGPDRDPRPKYGYGAGSVFYISITFNITFTASATGGGAGDDRDGAPRGEGGDHYYDESYHSFLERNWGKTALQKLRSYVEEGEFNITNIKNFAKSGHVKLLRSFHMNETLDPVEIFEGVLEDWYNNTLFKMSPEDAKNKLRGALKDSRCERRIEFDVTQSMN